MIIPQPPTQSELSDEQKKAKTVWSQWFSRIQTVLASITNSGPTANRPTSDLFVGQPFFDTTLDVPVFWDGSTWVNVSGTIGPPGPTGATGPAGPTGPAWAASYGSFYDTNATQTAANTTTDYAVKLNSTAEHSGVSISNDPSGNPTKINFTVSGVYNIQYSIQFTNSDTSIHNVNVWLRKNDTGTTGDVAYSNSQYAIINSHGGTHGQAIAAINYVMTLAAGDYLQLMWQPESTQCYIESVPAGTTPTTPVSPGVILTVCQVR